MADETHARPERSFAIEGHDCAGGCCSGVVARTAVHGKLPGRRGTAAPGRNSPSSSTT